MTWKCPYCGVVSETATIVDEPRYSWNQPICPLCFNLRAPGRIPIRVKEAENEVCVDCGVLTSDGIFLRVDPATARHPTRLKD